MDVKHNYLNTVFLLNHEAIFLFFTFADPGLTDGSISDLISQLEFVDRKLSVKNEEIKEKDTTEIENDERKNTEDLQNEDLQNEGTHILYKYITDIYIVYRDI